MIVVSDNTDLFEPKTEWVEHGMPRSPHRKRHRHPFKPLTYKTCTSGNRGGRAGDRYRKRHFRAAQPPGYPQGVCLGAPTKKVKDGIIVCKCGKHYRGKT